MSPGQDTSLYHLSEFQLDYRGNPSISAWDENPQKARSHAETEKCIINQRFKNAEIQLTPVVLKIKSEKKHSHAEMDLQHVASKDIFTPTVQKGPSAERQLRLYHRW